MACFGREVHVVVVQCILDTYSFMLNLQPNSYDALLIIDTVGNMQAGFSQYDRKTNNLATNFQVYSLKK